MLLLSSIIEDIWFLILFFKVRIWDELDRWMVGLEEDCNNDDEDEEEANEEGGEIPAGD